MVGLMIGFLLGIPFILLIHYHYPPIFDKCSKCGRFKEWCGHKQTK